MKNYKPFFFSISFFCVFSSIILFARPASEEGIKPLTIYGLKGPSGVGMIRMFESPPEINGFDIKMESLPSADLMAARLISGEAKMGILPANTAAKIFSSGGNIKLAAVTGAGMLRLLTPDPEIKRIEDLRGKTVAVAGHGAIPDYVFRRLLLVRGINPETDIHLNYSLAYPEIAQSLISGRISIALLPEPFATMARAGRADLREAVDIQEEWISSGGEGNYPLTVFVIDAGFAAANPPAVKTILESLKGSIEWVVSHPAEAGALVEKHGMGLKAAVVAAAVGRSNYMYVPALKARPAIEALFRVFMEYSPQSIGGNLPGDAFYLE